jgi:hypothetical protein
MADRPCSSPVLGTLVLMTCLLAGCVSSGPLGQLAPVPDDRAARIVFARPINVITSGVTTAVKIDGRKLYGLDMGQHVAFAVAAGERILGVETWDSSGFFVVTWPTAPLQAEAGRTYYYRILPGKLDRVTESEGLELVKQTMPMGGPAAR